jgi:pimeloyl-ACP methyl ester carboxylesterase
MLQHVRGNLDNWDPALTDAPAGEREVILVDYPGAGSSSGEFGPTIGDTARRMIAFLHTLDLTEIDLLGFSIGRLVAQGIVLIRPGKRTAHLLDLWPGDAVGHSVEKGSSS